MNTSNQTQTIQAKPVVFSKKSATKAKQMAIVSCMVGY